MWIYTPGNVQFVIFESNCKNIHFSRILFMRLIVSFFLLFFWFDVSGQKEVYLKIKGEDDAIKTAFEKKYKDSTGVVTTIYEKIKTWKAEGYILANVDSLVWQADTCKAYIFRGEKYRFTSLEFDTLWPGLYSERKRLARLTSGNRSIADWPLVAREVTTFFMDRGYPFCQVSLKKVEIDHDNLRARVFVEKGSEFRYDSIVIKGDLNVSNNFVRRYFQLAPGDIYNHSQIVQLNQRIKNLLFVKAGAEHQVLFENEQVKTYLFLNRSPVNRFDFIVGVLPNTNAGPEQRRWTITGDMKAEFYNRFGQGEYIFGQYKKLRPENQEMIVRFSIPYIYQFAFGLDSDFRLFRNGNRHIDLSFTGGVQYPFSGLNMIRFGYQYRSSRLIEVDKESIQASGRLPQNLDVVFRSGVISLSWWRTDYRWNPSKGFIAEAKINVGQRRILENSTITSIPGFEAIYGDRLLPTIQVESEWDVQYFMPVKTYGAFRLRFSGGYKLNSAGILQNEFYRIGGNATLRGFDEESIWTDRYAVFGAEFRLFLDRNSFITLPFVDFALTSVLQEEIMITDYATGLGLGINFSTKVGIFNVSFAAGNRLQSGFDFGNMKVHFGYLNLF